MRWGMDEGGGPVTAGGRTGIEYAAHATPKSSHSDQEHALTPALSPGGRGGRKRRVVAMFSKRETCRGPIA
jgi:hypothetical protein